MAAADDDEEGIDDVQEHLRDSVEGTLRLKRLLSADSEADGGSSLKRLKSGEQSPETTSKIEYLLSKWGLHDDKVMLHVLEGLEMDELEYLDSSEFQPDMFNWQQVAADQAATHVALWHERESLGGGPIDALLTFQQRWNLSSLFDSMLRDLSHKDLRYVLTHYDGTQQLEQLVAEAQEAPALFGRTEGCMPDANGLTTVSRFHRLELIHPLADAAVFGDANLGFALNLAKHRKVLGHVGRLIATTFESLEVLRERYKEIDDTIKTLEEHLVEVHHEIDCTRIAMNPKFKGLEGSLGAVYYNFPHAGSVGGFFDGHPLVNWRHENLMRLFFRALRSFMKVGGLVKVASNMGAVGVRFSYITSGAKENEFDHVETVPFLQWNLHRYSRSYGDRRDVNRRPDQAQNYNAQRAEKDMVYIFKYNPSGEPLGPQALRMPPSIATLLECQDGPFWSLPNLEVKKTLAKQLHERFIKECSGRHVG